MVASITPSAKEEVLNIVPNLNGILRHFASKTYTNILWAYSLNDNILCDKNPLIIGPKVVFARKNVGKFLRQVSLIADKVLVWTSMMKQTVEPIARHLFRIVGSRTIYWAKINVQR